MNTQSSNTNSANPVYTNVPHELIVILELIISGIFGLIGTYIAKKCNLISKVSALIPNKDSKKETIEQNITVPLGIINNSGVVQINNPSFSITIHN